MEKNKIVLLILLCICGHASSSSKTYFVRMKSTSALSTFEERNQLYSSSLESTSIPTTKIMYSYKHLDGFTVTLTDEEARLLAARDDVHFVQPTQMYQLHTTRTPLFMGMEGPAAEQQLPGIENGSNVIIGVLDTGVWPESPSFNDAGLGPVPSRWKGSCHEDSGIKCNNKLIGARAFYLGYEQALAQRNLTMNETKTARDTNGHGTHTTSTAGGSAVPNASVLGFANGTAHGMAQFARVAMYKVCWANGCDEADTLAGMDQAIEDKVDVISLSLGNPVASDHYMDHVAVGAFAATQKGILVSCSAGNSGPTPSVIGNVAPWILTVGAGTLDRDFPAPIKLGNKKTFHGVSLYKGGGTPLLPLVDARDASIDGNNSLCEEGTLVPAKVKGKIVLCQRGNNSYSSIKKGVVVQKAGGLGMVLAINALYEDKLMVDAHVAPATAVTLKTAQEIRKYLAKSKNTARASIKFRGTVVGIKPSPVLASFSSRGPSPLIKRDQLLKPDLIAPGVKTLAAWPKDVAPTGAGFNIISGTSMACPHVSGLAAMLKAAHPGWSPAAIRSALMTTAYSTYNKNGKENIIIDAATGKAATPYGIGAGHVAPMAALDPGLVYDLSMDDYYNFICALKYGPDKIGNLGKLTHSHFSCDTKKKYRVSDLNYPSFVVSVEEASRKGGVTHTRTLTNVGKPGKYKVSVLSPSSKVKISVHPETLTFNETNQKKSFLVKFQVVTKMQAGESLFARIEWSDDHKQHVVGSPIAFNS